MPEVALIHDSRHSVLWRAARVLKKAADWLISRNVHFLRLLENVVNHPDFWIIIEHSGEILLCQKSTFLHLPSGLGPINGLLFNFQFYLLVLCLILYQKEIINPFEARLQLLIQAKKTTKKLFETFIQIPSDSSTVFHRKLKCISNTCTNNANSRSWVGTIEINKTIIIVNNNIPILGIRPVI